MDAIVNDGSDLSAQKIATLVAIERTGASLSMIAITTIALSYLVYPSLRSTPNTFLLFASVANAGASIASMIGYDGLIQGEDSTLCQGQAFIFEWFMQADPWWSCAMACNVFLVFFCNVDPASFPRHIWIYCAVCFGGPLVPAITLISIRDRSRGPIFGDATLWCWIGPNWSLVRLYAYYIPIWICIFLSIVIYIVVGCHVFHHRNRLHGVAFPSIDKDGRMHSTQISDVDEREETCHGRIEYYATAITEVHVETNSPSCDDDGQLIEQPRLHIHTRTGSGCIMENNTLQTRHTSQAIEAFTQTSVSVDPQSVRTGLSQQLSRLKKTATRRLKKLDPVKMAYLRTSFIFGFTILITWIPSSVNRLYSIANDGHINFQLSAVSGTVLPLQGVWNALIYFTTSWKTVSQIRNGSADTIFGRRRQRHSPPPPRIQSSRLGAAVRSRSSILVQGCRRQSLRLHDIELQVQSPRDQSPTSLTHDGGR